MDDAGGHLARPQGGLHALLPPSPARRAADSRTDLRAAGADQGESRGVAATYGGIG
jgi:hypothetical protein